MTDIKIRIKVAELRGWRWKKVKNSKFFAWHRPEAGFTEIPLWEAEPQPSKEDAAYKWLPNYSVSFDAMHEACDILLECNNGWVKFIDKLCVVTGAVNCSMIDALVITNRATAIQWAEALLRLFDVWEEDT